jgi:hypothetical protein
MNRWLSETIGPLLLVTVMIAAPTAAVCFAGGGR